MKSSGLLARCRTALGIAIILALLLTSMAPLVAAQPTGWKYYEELTFKETLGVDRVKEPVIVTVRFSKPCSDPAREVRVYILKQGEWVEVPSQVLEAYPAPGGGYAAAKIAFLADVPAGGTLKVRVYYGNPTAPAPEYSTDLKVRYDGTRLTVKNSYYELTLLKTRGFVCSYLIIPPCKKNLAIISDVGTLEFEIFPKGGPEYRQVSGRVEDFRIIWSGPVLTKVYIKVRVGPVTLERNFTFFAYKPYIAVETYVSGISPEQIDWMRHFNSRLAPDHPFDLWVYDRLQTPVSRKYECDTLATVYTAAAYSTKYDIMLGYIRLYKTFDMSAGWVTEIKVESRVLRLPDLYLYLGKAEHGLETLLYYRRLLLHPLSPENLPPRPLRAPPLSEAELEQALKEAKTVVFLVPHSHWDPDWIYGFPMYAKWTANILTSALSIIENTKTFKFTICEMTFVRYIWENYPHLREHLLAALKKGRIKITGCGVSMPDTLIVDTEPLIRNFLEGALWAERTLGARAEGLWQIDPFGHAPTLPTLARALGYKYIVIHRVPEDAAKLLRKERALLFWWEGPDGSRVLTYWLMYGYCVCIDFPDVSSEKELDALYSYIVAKVSAQRPYCRVKAIMLPVGCDFSRPPGYLEDVVSLWNRRFFKETGILLVIGTVQDYFDYVEKLIREEHVELPVLRLDPNPYWSGFYVSRPELKRYNDVIEDVLLTAEFLSSFTRLLHGTYPEDLIFDAWWLHSHNQHHDDITGTSPDDTIANYVLPRYVKAYEIASSALTASLFDFAQLVDTSWAEGIPIVVMNPTQWERREVAIVELYSPKPAVRVFDYTGKEVPSQLLERSAEGAGYLLKVAFLAHVPPFGYAVYYAVPSESPGSYTPLVRVLGNGRILENDAVRVELDTLSMTFKLVNKRTGETAVLQGGDLLYYTDYGDSYDVDLVGKKIAASAGTLEELRVTESGPLIAEVELKTKLKVDGKELHIVRRIQLRAGESFARVSVTAAAVQDSTVVMTLKLGFKPSKSYYCMPFGYVERPLGPLDKFYPMTLWVAATDGTRSLVVAAVGTHGARVLPTGILEVMITRSVTTRHVFGGDFPMTDLEPHTIDLILAPQSGWDPYAAYKAAMLFRRHLVAVVTTKHPGVLKERAAPLLEVEGENVIVTGIKPGSRHTSIVLHLLNVAGERSAVRIRSSIALSEVYLCTALEDRLEKIGETLTLDPHGFATVELAPKLPPSTDLRVLLVDNAGKPVKVDKVVAFGGDLEKAESADGRLLVKGLHGKAYVLVEAEGLQLNLTFFGPLVSAEAEAIVRVPLVEAALIPTIFDLPVSAKIRIPSLGVEGLATPEKPLRLRMLEGEYAAQLLLEGGHIWLNATFKISLPKPGVTELLVPLRLEAARGFWIFDYDVVAQYDASGRFVGSNLDVSKLMDRGCSCLLDTEWPSQLPRVAVLKDLRGIPFALHSAEEPNAIYAVNRLLILPPVKAKALWILYAATCWPAKYMLPVTVYYADGSTSRVEVLTTDWCSRGVHAGMLAQLETDGHHIAFKMKCRWARAGARFHIEKIAVDLWATKVPLDPSKTVVAISIPETPGWFWIFALTFETEDGYKLVLSPLYAAPANASPTASIRGKLVDMYGNPVPDVTVACPPGIITRTGADGSFELRGVSIGIVTEIVLRNATLGVERRLTIPVLTPEVDLGTIQLPIALKPPANITPPPSPAPKLAILRGQVVDAETGLPIKDATIYVNETAVRPLPNGTFVVRDLPAGASVKLRVEAPGYESFKTALKVSAPVTDVGRIALRPLPKPRPAIPPIPVTVAIVAAAVAIAAILVRRRRG